MSAAFAFAYAAGVLAAFNPCGFAMLPGWVGYFLATKDRTEGDFLARLLGALGVGIVMSLGFIAVFSFAALAAFGGSVILNRILPVIDLVLAAILAGLGAYVLSGAKLAGLRLPGPKAAPSRSIRGMFVYGLGYGIATLSCVLPVFLVALGVATSGGTADRIAGFAGFSLGIMTVILIVAVLASLAKGAADRLRIISRYATVMSGGLLLVAAAYISWREIPLAGLSVGLAPPGSASSALVTGFILGAGIAVGMAISARVAARARPPSQSKRE